MSDFPGAIDMPSPHYWAGTFTPRRWIILHGTAGFATAQEVGAYFQTNNPPTSVHYVVGRDGVIVQCVSEGDSAWGNGVISAGHDPWWTGATNPNLQTFSIEHVKPHGDNSDTLTPAQQAASFALVAHLCKRYGIPPRAADASGGVTGHYSIDPVNRAFCPGPYPWQALWAYLGGVSNMAGVPAGWHDDGATLTAPNGETVDLGFRDHVLASNWNAAAVPVGPRVYDGHGNASQPFGLVLEWDKVSNTISEAAGAVTNTAALEAQIASLQQQIASLQQQLATAGGSGSVEAQAAVTHLIAAAKALGLTL